MRDKLQKILEQSAFELEELYVHKPSTNKRPRLELKGDFTASKIPFELNREIIDNYVDVSDESVSTKHELKNVLIEG